MTAPRPSALRLPAFHSVVGVVHDEDGDAGRFAERAERLRHLYAPLLPRGAVLQTRWLPRPGIGMVAVGPGYLGSGDVQGRELSDLVVWGAIVDGGGVPDDEHLWRVIDGPERLRGTNGVFVIFAATSGDNVRLVTSPTHVHTLKAVAGPHAKAWATRGLAAHVLAGAPPRLAPERAIDVVLYDHMYGSEELLEATRVLDDASVVDIGPRGASETCYWPLADRVAPGVTTTVERFRSAAGNHLGMLSLIPGAMLGLTGGRDSTLLAGSLHETSGSISTFTLGHRSFPDVRAARSVAEALGWPHEIVGVTSGGDRFQDLMRVSAWTEGLDNPRNLVAGVPDWDVSGVTWVSGHGGEVGRPLYWEKEGWEADPLGAIVDWPTRRVKRSTADGLRDRVSAALDQCRELRGEDDQAVFGLFYLLQRMHQWVMRSLPYTPIDNYVPGYLGQEVIRAMLDVSAAGRRNASLFDEALAACPLGLRALAIDASRGTRWGRLRQRFAHRLPWIPAPVPNDWTMLRPILEEVERRGSIVREVVGDDWWSWSVEAAPSSHQHRRMLWNAVGVEAFGAWIDETFV